MSVTICRRLVAGLALALVSGLAPSHVAAGSRSVVVSSAALTNVIALGVTAGATPVYVAMPDGLYRSLDPALQAWQRMNTVRHITLIAPNPTSPDDLVYTGDQGIFRSTDGGRSAARVSPCTLASLVRAPSAPTTLYAATSGIDAVYKDCPLLFQGATARDPGPKAVVFKSTDDGRHWSTVYRLTGDHSDGVAFTYLAVDPHDANHVLLGATFTQDVNSYWTEETRDGGKHWPGGQLSPVTYAPVRAMAFDPLHRDNAWVAWSNRDCLNELDLNQHVAHTPVGSITALAFDPVSGQLYVRFLLGCMAPTGAGVYLLDRATNRFVPIHAVPLGSLGASAFYLAITRTGYLVTAADGSRLVIVKLAPRAG